MQLLKSNRIDSIGTAYFSKQTDIDNDISTQEPAVSQYSAGEEPSQLTEDVLYYYCLRMKTKEVERTKI